MIAPMSKQIRIVLLGLVPLVGLGVAGWWLAVKLGLFLRSLQSDLAIAIVAAGIAGVVSVGSLAISRAYETQAATLQDLRAKKTPIYEGIVRTMFAVVFSEKIGKPPLDQAELIAWFAETTEKLAIWGSDDLVIAFGRFKSALSVKQPLDSILAFEALLLAIRSDLGHKNRGLSRGSILRLFVNDIDDALAKK